MKRLNVILCSALLIFMLSACQAAQGTAAPLSTESSAAVLALLPKPGETSMKGFELYSWQADGEWVFAILVGTNREKTLEEIQSPLARLDGLDALKKVLESIPSGETITWLSRSSLAFPPDDVSAQVQEMCSQHGLACSLAR
jgi:hypothetical protein